MKSTFYRKILDETVLEAGDTPERTIEKLRQQQGVCRTADFDGDPIEFFCSKKGKISVSNIARKRPEYDRSTYVLGEVTVENDKTVVKIYTVYDRLNYFVRLLCLGLSVVAGVLALLFAEGAVSVIGLLIAIVFSISLCVSSFNEKQTMHTDFEIMKAEIANRVQAVADWEK